MATSVIDYIFRELAISYLDRDDLAHVRKEDLAPDTVGDGAEEQSIAAANAALLDRVGQAASRGFARTDVRSSLVVLHGGVATGTDGHGHGHAHGPSGRANGTGGMTLQTSSASTLHDGGVAVAERSTTTVAFSEKVMSTVDAKLAKIREARIKGYEGESCGECGNFTLVRNGTCLKCDTCGGTSGCS